MFALCLLLALGWSHARDLPSDDTANAMDTVERWELPPGAAYKNTMPLIGIFTQPCHGCPGERTENLTEDESRVCNLTVATILQASLTSLPDS